MQKKVPHKSNFFIHEMILHNLK